MMYPNSIVNHLQKAFIAVALFVTLSAIYSHSAAAISNTSPDPAEYGAASGTIALSLNNTPTSPGNNTVIVPLYINQGYNNRPGDTSVDVTKVRPFRSRIAICYNGGTAHRSNFTFTVRSGQFFWDEVNQLWRYNIRMDFCTTSGTLPNDDDTSLTFRLVTSRGIIGYTPPGGGGVFSTDNSNGGSGFSNYTLQFATPCDVTTNTGNSIRLDDLDSGNQHNNYGTVTVSIYDVTAGSWVAFSTRGSKSLSDHSYYLDMTFKPKHKYKLHINNIYYYNVLQYYMPYDNIAYLKGCPDYSTSGSDILDVKSQGGGSYVNNVPSGTYVYPGDTIKWRHDLTLKSPTVSGKTIDFTYICNTDGGPWTANNAPGSSRFFSSLGGSPRQQTITFADPTTGACGSPYSVTAADIGNNYCHAFQWSPITDEDQGTKNSPGACAKVMARGSVSRDLVMDPGDNGTAMDGSTMSASFQATNTTVRDAQIKYNAWVWYEKQTPDRSYNAPGDQRFYNKSTPGWSAVESGPESYATIPRNSTSRVVVDMSRVVNLAQGSRVCAAWRVEAITRGIITSTPGWQIKCFRVGKLPSVRLWGNDARTGSGQSIAGANSTAVITGALAKYDTEYVGSWAEYSVLAPAAVTEFSSGSGLFVRKVNSQSQWSNLTFANQGSVYGKYAAASLMGAQPSIATYFTRPGLQGITVDNTAAAMTTVSGFADKVLIRSSGTVEITGDITNNEDANLQTVSSFPQMVIIARNINIRSNVTKVDAWLIASDTVNTCSDKPANLVASDCDRLLKVNGPLIAKSLRLRRTGGDRNTPAEIVNLRSDAYLWAHRISERNGRWETVYSEELPPRY